MSRVRFPAGWSYIGGDISPAALRDAKRFAPDRDFREFDLLTDPFPASDAWLCRACLFHLSFADIRIVLENFVRSDGKLAIITKSSTPFDHLATVRLDGDVVDELEALLQALDL